MPPPNHKKLPVTHAEADDTSFNIPAFCTNVFLFTILLVNIFKAQAYYAAHQTVEAYASSMVCGVGSSYLIYRIKRNKY